MIRRAGRLVAAGALIALVALGVATARSLRALPPELPGSAAGDRPRVVDRAGRILSLSFDTAWNVDDALALHAIPPLLREAFVAAEDRRYFRHRGVDWRARAAALVQGVRAGRAVRGASTISEQVVRMLHPRRRTAWTRWIEGLEARSLERRFSKGRILEFYLNQVPLGGRRRGVVQAARELFDRDPGTLSAREALTLAALARAPARLDPRRDPHAADRAVAEIARRLAAEGKLGRLDPASILAEPLGLVAPALEIRAPHFALLAREAARAAGLGGTRLVTTLDGSLQRRIEPLLARQLEQLAPQGAVDGAVLVVDHVRDEVVAWVNAGAWSPDVPGSQIDAILAPRQPGSTLKPFLYALALERGSTAATLVDDAPLSTAVGTGLHAFRNYGGGFRGPLRLREALGNSLNLPAIRTLRQVGLGTFLGTLHRLGLASLTRDAAFYGDGLALGSGEVTLRELVEAYAVLARGGLRRPVRVIAEAVPPPASAERVFRPETAALIADILADAEARALEFGRGGVLELPVPTAVKTGTSSDYRDAWAVGFSARHVVGVWIGDLDRRPMGDVTGAAGPGLVLRAVFAELRRDGDDARLALDRRLREEPICRASGAAPGPRCPVAVEWFAAGTAPAARCPLHEAAGRRGAPRALRAVRLARPTPDLHLALDPRIPDELEEFTFEIETAQPVGAVAWFVDDVPAGASPPGDTRFAWRLARGRHVARARVWLDGAADPVETERVPFVVK